MDAHTPRKLAALDDVLTADAWAREQARSLVGTAVGTR